MRALRSKSGAGLGVALLLGALATANAHSVTDTIFWQSADSTDKEDYVRVPMPPGFQVVHTELDGPVFATAEGMTLYQWPLSGLRNGSLGDRKDSGEGTCGDTVFQETSGYMSPYPPGFLLPELDKRRSCEQLWPPVLAEEGAKPVGKWTIAKHPSGKDQWAYDGYPLYTSDLDKKPGDVLGANRVRLGGAAGAVRVAVGPPPNVPPELAVNGYRTGRILVDHKGYTVYASRNDAPNKSNCFGDCLNTWAPVLAPLTAKPNGEWSIVERSPGIRQWAYRTRPLYTYVPEQRARTITGVDVPGWEPVFTQRTLPPPADVFTVQDSRIGQVLADANGQTIYIYACNDDARDQQTCDHPASPQVYRLAICGNFDAKVCNETFPYVKASDSARTEGLWSVMTINENTGEHASPGEPGAIQVWAYRQRPVYTFGRDYNPGDANGDSWGEFNGQRNGFKAFWLRDDYRGNVFGR